MRSIQGLQPQMYAEIENRTLAGVDEWNRMKEAMPD